MIFKLFSIYDSKADAYLPPFILPKTAQAVRDLSSCVNDPNHQFGKHPADYTLFELGTFDDETASFKLANPKTSVHNCLELIQTYQEATTDEKTELSDESQIQSNS